MLLGVFWSLGLDLMISNTLEMLKSVKLSVKYDSEFLYTYLSPYSSLKAFCSPVLSLISA